MSKIMLTTYQHAWTARDLEPDGASYATEAEADAAQVAAARNLIADDYDGDELADAIEEHTGADEVDAERNAAIRDGARLTDEEAIMAAESLRGYDSAVYPTHMAFDLQTLLAAIPLEIGGGEAPSTAAVLSTGAVLAQQAVDRWASGDLASAINALEEWAEEVRTALPGLDYGDDEEDLQAADEEAYMAARGWTPESFAETVEKIEGDAE